MTIASLFPHHLEQAPFDRGEDRAELVAATQDQAAFRDKRPLTLPVPRRGALLDLVFRMLGGAAEGPESRVVAAEFEGVILPLPGRAHAAVKVDDPRQLGSGEADLRAGGSRKRVDITHQARPRSFLAFLAGVSSEASRRVWPSSISSARRARSCSSSHWRISSF